MPATDSTLRPLSRLGGGGPARRWARTALIALLLLPGAARGLEPPLPGRVWYVDNSAAEGGDGSLVAPFHRLSRAERAADAGDTIYVFRGDGTDRGLERGVRLKPYQRLIGSGVPFAADGEEPLPASEPPVLNAGESAAVTLASHTLVAGLVLRGTGAVALVGRDLEAVKVSGVAVEGADSLGDGVVLERVRGAVLEGLRVAGTRDHAVRLEECSDVLLHGAVLAGNGDGAGDAGLLVRDPGGRYEITGLEVNVRDGRGVAVEAAAGSATVALEGASFAGDPATTTPTTAFRLTTGGRAQLTVRIGSAVVQGARRRGVDALATGDSRLALAVTGSGFVGGAESAEGIAVHASERAELDLGLDGNDVLGADAGVLATASGDARLRLTFADNVLPAVPRGRGVAILLADRAQASVSLTGNELAGQRAEAIFVRTAAASQLAADLRDNVIADAAAVASTPLPSILLESRENSRVCVSLSNNRIGEGPGGGAALLVRQLDGSVLTLLGHEGPAAAAAPALANDNRLGRVEVEAPAAAAAGGTPVPACPPLPPSAVPAEGR